MYATLHANKHNSSSSSSNMLGARPPLAHSVSGGVESELHAQYSMIAVVVLSALFFTVTVSATGLLLAFCKKNNAVFSLQHQQKAERDSHLEMDDLDKTDDEGDDDDDDDTGGRRGRGGSGPARPTPPTTTSSSSSSSVSRQQKQQQRRSRTFPDLFGLSLSLSPGPAPDPPASVDGSESSESLDARTPLMSGRGRAAGRTPVTSLRTEVSGGAGHRRSSGGDVAAVVGVGGGGDGRSAVTRSVTVAAIHHHRHAEGGGNSSVTVRLEDLQSGSELSDSALGHLYLKLEEEEEEEEEEEGDHEDSDVDDDLNSDLTRALLRC